VGKMRIKKFELGSHTVKVSYQKTVRNPDDGAEIFGLCDPMRNHITIATSMRGIELSEDVVFHSLCHELAHFIMILMNMAELNSNEPFIDMLGGFIAQFMKTSKAR
jgi:hypothetical protein